MRDRSRTVQIVCADPDLARRYLCEIERGGELHGLILALSTTEARWNAGHAKPLAILLDESAFVPPDSMGREAASMSEIAPVVAVGLPERQTELDALITTGRLDFVPRSGEFVPVAVGLLERRMQRAEFRGEAAMQNDWESLENFGELLRHEVNNPLTGILGNAEMLLARRDRLPPAAIERLETIAELAVRLRETVRRLSHTWEDRHDQVSSS